MKEIFLEGLRHIADFNGYDHLLFLLALIAPYQLKDWKKWLLLTVLFTIGHSVSLIIAAKGIIHINSNWVEFLIPLSILLTALYNTFLRKKSSRVKSFESISTVIIGLIHGFGFSGYFKMIVRDKSINSDMLFFNLGLEAGQIMFILAALVFGALCKKIPGVTQGYISYTFNFLAIILSARLLWENWIF